MSQHAHITPLSAVPGTVPGVGSGPDGIVQSPTSAIGSTASIPRTFGPGLPNTKRPAPFRKKLTRNLFIRPADQVGTPPSTAQSLRNAITYSWINVLLLCNPIAWALHFSHQSAVPTFVVSLLGVIPLAGMLGFGTEAIALYTGDALGGLINATLGNATEFIIAILLLVKCELRVVQASLLGGLLSNLLLVLGMAFLVGGIRYSEQEFMQTAAQLNTNLMTLAVVALIIPSAFAFALESAVPTDEEKRVILQMSRGSSIILICIYIAYLTFQLYSHAHYYNPAADTGAKYHSSSSSSSTSSSSSESEQEGRSIVQRVKRRSRKLTGRPTTPDGNEADSEKKPVASEPATIDSEKFAPSAIKPAKAAAAAADVTTSSGEPKPRKHHHRHRHHRGGDADGDGIEPVRRTQSLPQSQRRGVIPAHLTPPTRPVALPFGSAARLGGMAVRPSPLGLPPKHARFDVPSGKSTAVDATTNGIRHRGHNDLERSASIATSEEEEHEAPQANIPVALFVLLASTGLTYLTAEALTDSLEVIGSTGSVTPEWLGLILLAVVGNAAEHVTAVFVAYRNKVDLALSVSVGSCIQIALFVIPILVLLGWAIDKPLTLLFDPLETGTLFLSVLLVRFATEDGRTHYMSGVALVGTYILIAFSFWYYPSTAAETALFSEHVCKTHDY